MGTPGFVPPSVKAMEQGGPSDLQVEKGCARGGQNHEYHLRFRPWDVIKSHSSTLRGGLTGLGRGHLDPADQGKDFYFTLKAVGATDGF